MRLATFNVENLFDRARVMNRGDWAEGKAVLDAFAKLNELLGEARYTAAMRQRMVTLLLQLGLAKADRSRFVILRRNRGGLLRRSRVGELEIVAQGRADWVGSLELLDEPVDAEAMRSTARVMSDLRADVLAVVEAESRPALLDFNAGVVTAVGGTPFDHVMLVDGNDRRGIDVGLLTREGFTIESMRSHVDDRDAQGELVFSRDCPEYLVAAPHGQRLRVLVNHFKSKGYGGKAASDEKRRRQAERVAAIYRQLVKAGEQQVAIVGDFNDTPDSAALAPLLHDTDLRDVFTHPRFDDGGFPGTFGLCNAANKIDYILLSPALFDRVHGGGVWRKGLWPGQRPVRWEAYPEITSPVRAASDHAAVWVDLVF